MLTLSPYAAEVLVRQRPRQGVKEAAAAVVTAILP